MPEAHDDLLAKEKQLLELMKLRDEHSDREWQRPLARKKAGLEVQVVKLQRVQHVAVAFGVLVTTATFVLSYCTYRKSIADASRREFKSAVTRYQEGSVAAIAEMTSFEDFEQEMLNELVDGIEPLPSAGEPAWPEVTDATLNALVAHKDDLDGTQRHLLHQKMTMNERALDALAAELAEKSDEPKLVLMRKLTCVQLGLQQILEYANSGWPRTWATIIEANGATPPRC